jgi:hypothetical protein
VALEALGRISADPEVVVPILTKALLDKSPHAALLALSHVQEDSPLRIESLCLALSHAQREIRLCAALQLGMLGPRARVALPSLRALLLDPANEAVTQQIVGNAWLASLGPKRLISVREGAAAAIEAIEPQAGVNSR